MSASYCNCFNVISTLEDAEVSIFEFPDCYADFTITNHEPRDVTPPINEESGRCRDYLKRYRELEEHYAHDDSDDRLKKLFKKDKSFTLPQLVLEKEDSKMEEAIRENREGMDKLMAKQREKWAEENWKAHNLRQSISQSMIKAQNYNKHLRILVLGDHKTGKTEFVQKFMEHNLKDEHEPGLSTSLRSLKLDNDKIGIQLWDVSDESNVNSLKSALYTVFCAALVLFDVSRPETMDVAVKWKTLIQGTVLIEGNAPFLLVANKSDLTKKGIVGNSSRMIEFVDRYGFCSWTETNSNYRMTLEDSVMSLVSKVMWERNQEQSKLNILKA